MSQSTIDIYTQRRDVAVNGRDTLHRVWSIMGNMRLVASIIALVGLWQQIREPGTLWQICLVVGITATIGLAVQQRALRIRRDLFESMRIVNEHALSRYSHNWDDLPLPPDSGATPDHPYARDLNVVGRASIAQRIGTPVTEHGWNALYDALLNDHDLTNLSERQKAIQELAGEIELRQNVEAVGLRADSIPDAAPLLAWASATDWLRQRSWLRWIAIIGPALLIILAIAAAFGLVSWPWLLVPITLNTLTFTLVGSSAAAAVQYAVPMRDAVTSSRSIMRHMARIDPTSPYLKDLDARLTGAAKAMAELGRIADFAIPPGSMLYFPMQMAFMWDINVLDRLENWRAQHGADVDDWLNAMGEWESLAALSVLTHDYPDWATPEIETDGIAFVAGKMAHPLLSEDIAVANDVGIGPAGSFLFVTGSNMSGKSTLLRAIGANAVLAQAGASVCASLLIMPPLRISTCMRVEDSLAQGVSFFMAELLRLKSVVENAKQSDDRMALYLLDEILQGTNTAERQIASRHVLGQLTGLNAIGAVSSHDLELIEGTSLEEDALTVHFAENFTRVNGEPDMTFDYRLRAGLATSSNAIRLMEMIGFDVPD